MQIGIYLISVGPNLLNALLILIGLFSALEGKKLNIAGMNYFSIGFALLLLANLMSIGFQYFIVVMHAYPGPMISLGYFAGWIAGILGWILVILGVRAIVSAYKVYLSGQQYNPKV